MQLDKSWGQRQGVRYIDDRLNELVCEGRRALEVGRLFYGQLRPAKETLPDILGTWRPDESFPNHSLLLWHRLDYTLPIPTSLVCV